ncbi:transposase [Nostoc sp. XA010]|nr:transposase [Nostoc sp. XA010]
MPKEFRFEQPKSPPVVVNFNGGQVTSDAGLSLIAELDRKLQITSRLARCFQDCRQANRMLHPIESLIAQRIYGNGTKKSSKLYRVSATDFKAINSVGTGQAIVLDEVLRSLMKFAPGVTARLVGMPAAVNYTDCA